jgi:hypothetical protein
MAKEKDTPNLPGSSRLQPPSVSGNSMIKETGGMKGGSKGISKKVLSGASKKGMKGTNPYC